MMYPTEVITVLILAGLTVAALPTAVASPVAVPANTSVRHAVEVYEIPSPSLAREHLLANADNVYDALDALLPSERWVFVVVATTGNGYLVELRPESGTDERREKLEQLADRLDGVSQSGFASPQYRDMLTGIERRVREETAGTVVFFHHRIASRGLTSLASVNPGTIGQEPPPKVTPRDSVAVDPPTRERVWRKLWALLWKFGVAVGVLVGLVFFFRRRLQQRCEYEAPPPASLPEPEPSARRNYIGRTAHDESRRQQRSSRSRRTYVTAAILVVIQTTSMLPAVATTAANVGEEPDEIVTVDASLSTNKATLAEARRVIATVLLEGRTVRVIAFGDSARIVGDIIDFAGIDTVLAKIRGEHKTRLVDGITFTVEEARKLRRKGGRPLVHFISDFDPDDDGNEALAYLAFPEDESAVPGGLPVDSTATGQRYLNEATVDVWIGGSAAAGLLAGILLSLAWTGWRRRRADARRQERPALVVTDGLHQAEVLRKDLHRQKTKIVGHGSDAVLRVPDGMRDVCLTGHIEGDTLKLALENETQRPPSWTHLGRSRLPAGNAQPPASPGQHRPGGRY